MLTTFPKTMTHKTRVWGEQVPMPAVRLKHQSCGLKGQGNQDQRRNEENCEACRYVIDGHLYQRVNHPTGHISPGKVQIDAFPLA